MKINFINTKHLPQKIKFVMNVDEYNHFLPYFDKANLYKIVLKDNVKSLENLKIPNNVSIVFNS
jgi:ribosome-associated toxin RatA of RatAB toxin-antitoxin module